MSSPIPPTMEIIAISSPPHTVPAQRRPDQHHHRTRIIAHQVRESLTRRCAKLLCAMFLFVLFAGAVFFFIVFLVLRPHRPRFHLSSFSFSSTASFNVSIRNPNREIGIHYDSMSAAVFYKDVQVAVFDHIIIPFYQPPKNTTVVVDVAPVRIGEVAAQEIATDKESGRVGFRLELRSIVRFRVTIWDTHRDKMHVSCGLEVGPDGSLIGEFRDKRCSIFFV